MAVFAFDSTVCVWSTPGLTCESRQMEKRSLRVVNWIGTTPAVALCTLCGRQFAVPLASLAKVADATESLRVQFVEHNCRREDASRNP